MSDAPDQIKPSDPTPVDSGSQALAEALHSSFAIVKFVMSALLVLFLFSGVFKVELQEKAIILRFGKPVGEGEKALLGSGLHWSWPYPIDEVVKVPITEIQQVKSTVGWYAQTPEQEALNQEPLAGASLNPAVDGYVLTADGNIIHAKATLSYRIEDPNRCVFGFAGHEGVGHSLAGVSNAVQNALNNALVQTSARFSVDDILLRDAIGFQEAVKRRVVALIAARDLGITVDQCVVDRIPPRQLKQVFANVVMAGQNRAKLLDEARGYENETLSKAGADSAGRINAAEADRSRLVAEITADAKRFSGLRESYERNPDLFVQQRLAETMSRVFTNAQDKMFVPTRTDGKPVELRLNLNREPPKAKAPEAK